MFTANFCCPHKAKKSGGALVLCRVYLSLCSCTVIDGEPSVEFMSGWLWLCQVHLGSGCRCLDINTTMMKANTLTDWLNQWLCCSQCRKLTVLKGEQRWFSQCNWVSWAIYVNGSMHTELLPVVRKMFHQIHERKVSSELPVVKFECVKSNYIAWWLSFWCKTRGATELLTGRVSSLKPTHTKKHDFPNQVPFDCVCSWLKQSFDLNQQRTFRSEFTKKGADFWGCE